MGSTEVDKQEVTMKLCREALRPGLQLLWDRKAMKHFWGFVFACERIEIIDTQARLEILKVGKGVEAYRKHAWNKVRGLTP